ncbi:hypothetical protein P7K49_026634 [Saguinus oedipus]|uniref:Uncharacterized protein n=1 Tax=Saguinus oedipus TaxID=9490 RepID=A0ABQ9UDP7_SAGOE|nr:hypothetical protein P7K49_026634 [Saguinus oedipus]
MQFRRESQQWSTGTLIVERETWDMCALPQAAPCLGQAEVSTAVQTVPTALSPQDLGALCQHFSRPSQVTVPIPPTHQSVHSKASQVRLPTLLNACWAPMALLPPCDSSCAPASGPLLTQPLLGPQSGAAAASEAAPREDDHGPGPAILSPAVQGEGPRQIPLLSKRRPQEPLSNLRGFFPATVQPRKGLPALGGLADRAGLVAEGL